MAMTVGETRCDEEERGGAANSSRKGQNALWLDEQPDLSGFRCE